MESSATEAVTRQTPGTRVSAAAHDIFVIGASAGGIASLRALWAALPADFPGSIFAVVHISPESPGKIAEVFERAGPLPVVTPDDGAFIVPGRIYVAPPDRHMLLEGNRVRVVRGPKENRHRPAIDPLFRSAAWAYGPRVVGVVLTGYLDDGTAGLWAIKTCGGVTVVQDPSDALHPQMPMHALSINQVDHCVPLQQMPGLLTRLARTPVVESTVSDTRPQELETEVEFAESERDIKDMGSLGKLSPFTCPGCGGALWELADGGLLRYRCHTGHAFTADSLLLEQGGAIERALYMGLRAIEEKSTALRRLRRHWNGRYPKVEADYEAKARELDESAGLLRKLLTEHDI